MNGENIIIDFQVPEGVKTGETFRLYFTISNPFDVDIDLYLRFFINNREAYLWNDIIPESSVGEGEIFMYVNQVPFSFNVVGEAYSDGVLLQKGELAIVIYEKPSPTLNIPLVLGASSLILGGVYGR